MPTLSEIKERNKVLRFRSKDKTSPPIVLGTYTLPHGDSYPYGATLAYENVKTLDQTNQQINGKYFAGHFFGLDRISWYKIPGLATSKSYNFGGANKNQYKGSIVCDLPPYYATRFGDSPFERAAKSIFDNETLPYGAEALSKLRPDSPLFDLSTAILELKDVPGALRQRFVGSGLQNVSNLALAYQFGWAPLFRDVRDFVIESFNVNKAANNLIANEGRPVRRRRNLRSESVSIEPIFNRGYSAIGPQPFTTHFYADLPYSLDTATCTDNVWAVGNFRYSLPGGERTTLWKANLYRKLLGLELSPKTVYNLIPWSFLIDYFASIGDYVDAIAGNSTVSELSNLGSYVMRHKKYHGTRQCSYTFWDARERKVTGSCYSHIIYESKRRTVIDSSNPGIEFGKSLTDQQAGILGLLGLSRFA